MTDVCTRCLKLAFDDKLRVEAVQPLPEGAAAPLDNEGRPQCRDCNAAEVLSRTCPAMNWYMARVAVANNRQESLRLPGFPLGLIKDGYMRASEKGDLERHHKWLRMKGLME